MTEALAADDSLTADDTFAGTVSSFEKLSLTTVTGSKTVDLANLNDISYVTTTAATALTLNNMASAGTLELTAATNVVTVNVDSAATGTADILNVVLKNSTAGVVAFGTVTAANVETVNLTTTDSGTVADTAATIDTATVAATSATKITVTGNDGLTLTNTGNVKVTTFDASGVVGDGTDDTAANLAVTFTSANTTATATVHITGGAGNDALTGGATIDVIVGGAGKDVIKGAANADTLTGGAGNDTFVYGAVSESTLIKLDVITDFTANTFGQGASGAATSAGANAGSTSLNGDLINLNAVVGGLTDINVGVQTSAADAQTFLQNTAADTVNFTGFVGAALDSSSSKLYIDVDNNGTVDMVLQLTGVTTITSAAFVL
jgi:Ca2+-binding RTX toxin-like protein